MKRFVPLSVLLAILPAMLSVVSPAKVNGQAAG